jgi:hypothetical protein
MITRSFDPGIPSPSKSGCVQCVVIVGCDDEGVLVDGIVVGLDEGFAVGLLLDGTAVGTPEGIALGTDDGTTLGTVDG